MSSASSQLWEVSNPSLDGLAIGTASLELLEAVDFSADNRLVVVRAKFSDDGDTSFSFKYAHFIYDIKTNSYIANLNSDMGDDARATQTIDARIVGTAASWEVVANVRVTGQDWDELRSYKSDETLTRDLLGSELGSALPYLGSPSGVDVEAFSLGPNKRFLAVQTDSTLLAINNDDSNSSQDIYLIDRNNDSIERVSTIGGSGLPGSVYLADMFITDSEINIAFVTGLAFSTDDLNSSDSTLSDSAKDDLYVASTTYSASAFSNSFSFDLKSIDSSENATGYVSKQTDALPIMTSSGIYFSSSATNLVQSDDNASTDVFLAAGSGIERVTLSGINEISAGAEMVGASSNGKTVYIKSSSEEFRGSGGVDKVIKVSTTDGSYEIAAGTGVTLGDTVVNGAVSPSGGIVGFTSLDSNLADYGLYIFDSGATVGKIYDWSTHTLLSGVRITPSSGEFEEASSGSDGSYELSAMVEGTASLTLSRDIAQEETAFLDIDDALAALRLGFGFPPGNPKEEPTSAYQFYAADANGDGIIDISDALDILKMSFDFSGAPEKEWLFIDEQADLSGITFDNVDRSKLSSLHGPDPTELNFVGVFKGDVIPSWTMGDPSKLEDSYFEALEQAGVAAASQWWVV